MSVSRSGHSYSNAAGAVRDIDKLNVVVDALVVVGMEHTSSAERNEVAYVRNQASSAGRIKSPICERIGASVDQPVLH